MPIDRQILFSGPMVRALLAGSKTQTRRVVKVPHENPLGKWEVLPWGGPNGGRTRDGQTMPFQNVIAHARTGEIIGCPYGQPGDRLWVRETWAPNLVMPIEHRPAGDYLYAATNAGKYAVPRWKPSIHMPRAASRITLEITGVRVERLQDISEADASEEGCGFLLTEYERWDGDPDLYRKLYRVLWEQINGPGSWAAKPWVWVIQFKPFGAV